MLTHCDLLFVRPRVTDGRGSGENRRTFSIIKFSNTSYMTFVARERRFNPGFDRHFRLFFIKEASGERENIGIIVLTGKSYDIHRPGIKDYCSHPFDPIGTHGLALSRLAY